MNLQPKKLVIQDDRLITLDDVSSCVCYKEADVQKGVRQDVCKHFLRKFNKQINIQIDNTNINNEQFLHSFDVVIITDFYDYAQLCEINEICRTRPQKPVGFIYATSLGLFNVEFVDFGKDFKIYDADGEEVYPYLIQNISKSDPGIVTIHKDKPHNF